MAMSGRADASPPPPEGLGEGSDSPVISPLHHPEALYPEDGERMEMALEEARLALDHDDVPVGAVVVLRWTTTTCR